MSEAYELLETLQEDVIAILKATPTLAAANVIAEQNGDLESEVERILGFQKGGSGGKRGLAVIVMMPEVTEAEANLPGPPFLIKQEIQIIEHPRINRTTAGTGLRSSHAALLALNALHFHATGTHTMYAEDRPIQPLPMKDGLVSHVVSVFARAGGMQGPGKVLAVTADLGDGGTVTMEVGGTLTSNGTTPVVFPPLALAGTVNGRPSYEAPGYLLSWDDMVGWQLAQGDPAAFWNGAEDVATPDLVTTWNVSAPATGTPTITASSAVDTIILTCATEGAAIWYTTDGTYPTPTNGTLYTAPFAAPAVGTTIRAAGYKTGLNPGDCLEFTLIDLTPDGTVLDGDLALADANGTILTDI